VNPILAAESIGKSFGRRTVLTAAGVWATPGRTTVVLGRNGCGKTTLLRIACGLLRPDYGVVIFRGERLLRPKLWKMARQGLFFLPERALLHRGVSGAQHFDAIARQHGSDQVRHAIDLLRLADLIDRKPRQLSGGERRRIEVGLALARQPACLLADEPFMGIMPNDAELLQRAFRTLTAQGTAIILTGHEVRSLLDAADDVVWHTAGTTHVLGDPEQARRHDQFRREYLAGVLIGD
jgi:ABC-type multidrug transport system ATPase subunit